jgi:type II secretory ATPase GspE/PulE/Tfp pilus assembly ATPase PilB-like protein
MATKTKKKDIKDIKDLPEGWRLLTDPDKKDNVLFKIDEKLATNIAIISCSTVTSKNNKVNYIQFIGVRDALMNQVIVGIKESLLNDNKNVIFSPVKDLQLIKEIYKSSKDQGMSKERDYSNESGVIKNVNDLFVKAIDEGASDIHIEVRKGKTEIRCRINGEIRPMYNTTFAESTGREWARVIYQVMSTVSNATFNEKQQQDALVEGNFGGYKLRVRIATNPTEPKGFDMVMRLLIIQDSTKPLKMTELGYQDKQAEMIHNSMAEPVGLTIVAGTTGSGKSTTLQNLLMTKILERGNKIKVITVEDPPEYFIPGASQVPVIRDENGDGSKGFQSAIKAAMRSDPDILMIGEIRDEQSAQVLIGAVQSGHQVISTIHSGSALDVIGRLKNLGVGRDVLGSEGFIAGLIYQKLLPKLCQNCSISLNDGVIPSKYSIEKILYDNYLATIDQVEKAKSYNPRGNLIRSLQDLEIIDKKKADKAFEIFNKLNEDNDDEALIKRLSSVSDNIKEDNIMFRNENGCEKCKGKGITGRTVVSEVVRPDMHMLNLISQGLDNQVLNYWRKNQGGRTAREDACDKMLKGIVSPIDVEHELGLIGVKKI